MCKTALAALAVVFPAQFSLKGIHILQDNGVGAPTRPAETCRGRGTSLRWPAEWDGGEPGHRGEEVKLEKLSSGGNRP